MTVAAPIVQVSLFPRFNPETDVNRVNPSSISGPYSYHCKYKFRYFFYSPKCVPWGWNVYLGECWLTSCTRLPSDSLFFEAQAFDCRWETQTNQTKTLWWIEPRIPLSPPAFGFGFALSFRFKLGFDFDVFFCLVNIFCFNLTNL